MEISTIDRRKIRDRAALIESLVTTPMGIKKDQSLTEAKGFAEWVKDVKGDDKKALVAMSLHNARTMLAEAKAGNHLFEDTQSMNIAQWEKFGMPLIAQTAESLIASDLVTVQPLEGPEGVITYMDFVAGATRGNIKKGDLLWNSKGGHTDKVGYSSETIRDEDVKAITATISAATPVDATLSYAPLRPTSVVIDVDGKKVMDDGNGNLVGDGVAIATAGGTINYATGAIVLNALAVPAGTMIQATYTVNSEGTTNTGVIDFVVTSTNVKVRRVALRGRWSFEAEQLLNALHGTKAEGKLSATIAAEIQFEIDRGIIQDLLNIASAGQNTWSATPPSNGTGGTAIDYQTHKLSFLDAINELSTFIYAATKRVRGNWVVVGIQGMQVLLDDPRFVAASDKADLDGACHLGKLNGIYEVYVDPHLNHDEYLVGYKGSDQMKTGYVFAPWMLLYSSNTIALDDMTYRKGFASQFGKKTINGKYYAKGKITSFPNAF